MTKKDFLKYQAQTTPHPLAIEISHAKGCYVYDVNKKKYLDFIAGVSANSLGHNHPKVSQAIKNQLDKYKALAENIIILPLYPQYSCSTTASIYDQVAHYNSQQRYVADVHIIRDY